MLNSSKSDTASTVKLPMMLSHLTTCHLSQNYMLDDELFDQATFSVDRKINIDSSGMPLHCSLSKTPPTSCQTPGKWVPGGYTPSGKSKPGHQTTLKTDKRAGH